MARKPVSQSKSSRPQDGRPILQWLMAALGAAVTLVAISIVIWEALQPDSAKGLSATLSRVERTHNGYLAEILVHNDGLETATGVDVQGELGDQTATATIDYVPGRGHATAYLAFDREPHAAQLTVLGWSEP